ncbi:MAG: hypothetical protein JW869_04380, partial [Candidatus Omnitrophica bacterium]|nr:hypothetical protein [Candidatus Omnitrophota bacterium]
VAITIGLILVSLLYSNIASAITIRIDQPKVRLQVARGGEKSGTIAVENPSEVTAFVSVYVEDWLYSSTADGSKNFFPPGTTDLSCAKWITFGPAELQIPPFGKQAITYSVSCPSDADGAHYAVLFFETSLGETEDEQGVSVNVMGRLGSLFVVEPEGTVNRDAKLTNLSVNGKLSSDSEAKLSIQLNLENTGNVDFASEGTFYIMDDQGLIVARGELSPCYTLPGDKGTIYSNVSKASPSQIPAGEYDLIITIDIGGIPKVLEVKLNINPSGEVSYSGP